MSLEEDVHAVHKAISGLGTDDTTLIDIIGSRNRIQREQIAAAYQTRYGHSLVKDIKGDTSFNYKDLLVGLVTPLPEYVADLVHHAVAGLGTKEGLLIDIFATTPGVIIQMADQVYKAKYGKDILKDVEHDTSGNFRSCLKHLIRGSKDFFGGVGSPETVQHDAHELYHKGAGRLGTDDDWFINFFTHKSPAHIMAVDAEYRAKRGKTVVQAIESETSFEYKNLLVALAIPPALYWAERIHDAIAGLGTNDERLQRAYILNDKDALRQIALAYKARYGKDMEHEVKGDTSGHYAKLLSHLVR
eukprot:TRINITY_DN2100_c0_g1_i1.p1 TRINITY_DN2100_c0_g1~~TRINITY_DN2100_c0_g1_i1.p1  ORF type:complete len:302 (-),score=51.03 TRINITY_DN2100_c0_g1_i1:139-1044(-)